MMDFLPMLEKHYDINASNITSQKGGWASLAYKVEAGARKYFLKVYDKSRTSTHKWTSLIDDYIPLVLWLNTNTSLYGKIANPIVTTQRRYKCEDDKNIYILFDYIDGKNLDDDCVTEYQTIQLSEIIAELHKYDEQIPLPTSKIKEDFSLPFCIMLYNFFYYDYINCPADLKCILDPYIGKIKTIIEQLQKISYQLINCNLKYVLCHTDIHGGNIIQNDHLVLVDWEGLKLAPPEADLFALIDQPYWNAFISAYKNTHNDFMLNNDVLEFYLLRRKAEDIWEWIEQLQYDNLNLCDRQEVLKSLQNECITINW